MSGVEEYATALGELKAHPGTFDLRWSWPISRVIPLLDALLIAWVLATPAGASEAESRRWSDVCSAALALLIGDAEQAENR